MRYGFGAFSSQIKEIIATSCSSDSLKLDKVWIDDGPSDTLCMRSKYFCENHCIVFDPPITAATDFYFINDKLCAINVDISLVNLSIKQKHDVFVRILSAIKYLGYGLRLTPQINLIVDEVSATFKNEEDIPITLFDYEKHRDITYYCTVKSNKYNTSDIAVLELQSMSSLHLSLESFTIETLVRSGKLR